MHVYVIINVTCFSCAWYIFCYCMFRVVALIQIYVYKCVFVLSYVCERVLAHARVRVCVRAHACRCMACARILTVFVTDGRGPRRGQARGLVAEGRRAGAGLGAGLGARPRAGVRVLGAGGRGPDRRAGNLAKGRAGGQA